MKLSVADDDSERGSGMRPTDYGAVPTEGVEIEDGDRLGWKSLRFIVYRYSEPCPDAFETPPFKDQTILVMLDGSQTVAKSENGSWVRSPLLPGSVGLTPPGQRDVLRYDSKASFAKARIGLPVGLIEEVADTCGGRVANIVGHLNALAFTDLVILAAVRALRRGLESGAPDMVAEVAGMWLASHLLRRGQLGPGVQDRQAAPERIADRRLKRAVEMMRERLAEKLSLTDISKEAGISKFHLVRAFREKIGITPYALLVEMRLQNGRRLLETTDLDIPAIAFRCGYNRVADFTAAFVRRFGDGPEGWR